MFIVFRRIGIRDGAPAQLSFEREVYRRKAIKRFSSLLSTVCSGFTNTPKRHPLFAYFFSYDRRFTIGALSNAIPTIVIIKNSDAQVEIPWRWAFKARPSCCSTFTWPSHCQPPLEINFGTLSFVTHVLAQLHTQRYLRPTQSDTFNVVLSGDGKKGHGNSNRKSHINEKEINSKKNLSRVVRRGSVLPPFTYTFIVEGLFQQLQ